MAGRFTDEPWARSAKEAREPQNSKEQPSFGPLNSSTPRPQRIVKFRRILVRLPWLLWDGVRVMWVRDTFIYGAAMTYFTILSVVPLVYLVGTILSDLIRFSPSANRQETVLYFIQHFIPRSTAGLIANYVSKFLDNLHSNLTLVTLAVILYNAYSLVYQLNKVFHRIWIHDTRTLFWRVFSDLLVLSLVPIFFFFGIRWESFWGVGAGPGSLSWAWSEVPFAFGLSLSDFVNDVVNFFLEVVFLFFLFWIIPAKKVRVIACVFAALTVWLLLVAMNLGFTLSFNYLNTRYDAVYGAFATVILVMFWLYLFWNLVIYGACLSYVFQARLASRVVVL